MKELVLFFANFSRVIVRLEFKTLSFLVIYLFIYLFVAYNSEFQFCFIFI